MKRIYDVGSQSKPIFLEVNVGTVGTAYTSVYIQRTGGQSTKIAESNANNGNIDIINIGDALQIKISYLVIRTTIDFSNITDDLWSDAANNVVIKYKFDGGFSGTQFYNYDNDDVDIVLGGKVIVITKPIELI